MAAVMLARLLHRLGRIEEAQEWANKFVVHDSEGNLVDVNVFEGID